MTISLYFVAKIIEKPQFDVKTVVFTKFLIFLPQKGIFTEGVLYVFSFSGIQQKSLEQTEKRRAQGLVDFSLQQESNNTYQNDCLLSPQYFANYRPKSL